MQNFIKIAGGIIVLLIVTSMLGLYYTVSETEIVIITQFGKMIGEPITDAGLHFKTPLIQTVNRIEKRVLQWDEPGVEMPTKDKLYISVDIFARWRIADPLHYFTSLRDERSALSRLDDIIGSETRNTVARHELVELIRTTKDRQPVQDEAMAKLQGIPLSVLPPVRLGRVLLEEEITKEARTKLSQYGIELLDVRFKRINYNSAVAAKIYDRMISERRQIAERFRSEGAGEAAKILGRRERDSREIESGAYRDAQILQGKADAEASAIYAKAFDQSPESREFFAFQRSLETYKTTLTQETTAVFTTDSGFLQYLKGSGVLPPLGAKPGQPAAVPAAR